MTTSLHTLDNVHRSTAQWEFIYPVPTQPTDSVLLHL